MTLLFCLSIFHPLAFFTRTLERIKIHFYIVPCLLDQFSPSCIGPSVLVPVFAGHHPNTFSTKLKSHHFDLLAMSCPPKCDLRLSQLVFGIFSQPPWSFTLPLYLHMFAASSASRTPTLVCLFTTVHFSFGFGFSSLQSFHSSTRQ